MMRAGAWLSAFALVSLSRCESLAWGERGHRIVTEIAEQHLTMQARKKIREILRGERFSDAAVWADDIKHTPAWKFTAPWHYIDSANKNRSGDVVEALQVLEKFLKSDKSTGKYQGHNLTRNEALKFFIHFVGDIHQPFHVGNGKDAGGNACIVKWKGQALNRTDAWNLHAIWDYALISEFPYNATQELKRASMKNKIRIEISDYETWKKESAQLRPKLYPQLAGKNWSEYDQPYCKNPKSSQIPDIGKAYVEKNLPIVKSQLLAAGLRLAGKLNEIFTSSRARVSFR
jgi:hypothetical protein